MYTDRETDGASAVAGAGSGDAGQAGGPSGPAPTLFEAIVRKRCVAATYNRGEVVLAPHAAFMRHDELHVAAVTITRDGKPPRDEKVGIFKVDGLVDLKLAERDFSVSPVFERDDERFADAVLLAVES